MMILSLIRSPLPLPSFHSTSCLAGSQAVLGVMRSPWASVSSCCVEQKVKRLSDLAAEFFGTVQGFPRWQTQTFGGICARSVEAKRCHLTDFVVVSCKVSLVT